MKRFSSFLTLLVMAALPFTFTSCDDDWYDGYDWYDKPYYDATENAIALAQSDGNLGYGSLAVSVEKLCTVQDNGVILLTCAGKEARNVNKRYDRNVEGIAEAHEAGSLA